ncbi:hypothetical protein GALMADRAFT_237098 [Galerina marginata CBS 339.88]|uniref:F-box domain-containing protein n=1 Tax=Galerina marginata (strain CBS 339.88) TaxID=685588 RepID=A0A067TM57_GALM3|nr:hypothetical protein GALMADRAFT_237098 [Galerina marginata CBS 339.88]
MKTTNEGCNSGSVGGRSTGKRKADSAPEERPAAKKRRGDLQIVEMPMAVLFKIFALLEPRDLLHLARTTKDFRKSLMTRSSAPLWRTARSNVPGPQSSDDPSMPDCPPDLSEPQYADLVFGEDCNFCGVTFPWIHRRKITNLLLDGRRGKFVCLTLWAARLRTCFKCLHNDTHFISRDDCEPSKDCPADLIRWLPTTGGKCDVGVPIEIITLREEEYKKAKKKKDWLFQNQKRQKQIAKHAAACEAWADKMQWYRHKADKMLREQRKAAVVEYIQKLGWGEELSKISKYTTKPQDSDTVRRACTEQLHYSRLETFINQFMGDAKGKRLIRERKTFLANFKQEYDAFLATLPVNTIYPVISDVLQDPVIRRIISPGPGPSTPVAKTNFVSQFSSVGRRWQRTIEDKLTALVAAACGGEHGPAPETVIDLATAWFTCSKCDAILRYPLVLMHDCATHIDANWVGPGPDTDWAIVRRLFQRVPWNSLGYITFNRAVLACISKVLELCHVDPVTTTAQEMDTANHILECVTCNDPREGRPTMTWSRMVHHWHHTHANKSAMNVAFLSDQNKAFVQAQMREMQARRAVKRDYKGLVCSHCRLTGNMVDLAEHLVACHGRAQPTDKDIVPVLNEDTVPDIYWLWPPRKKSVPTPGLALPGDDLPIDEDDMYL